LFSGIWSVNSLKRNEQGNKRKEQEISIMIFASSSSTVFSPLSAFDGASQVQEAIKGFVVTCKRIDDSASSLV
jgi:hypothetical protein